MDSQYKVCNTSEDGYIPRKHSSLNESLFKYFGQFLICILGFGLFFCYDNPGALQDKFEADLDMPASDFVLLYSVHSWPSVIFCFIGGFLLDRVFGIRWGTVIYALLTLCGQLMFAWGAYVNIFWLMLSGRFLFGCGTESLTVAQYNYAVLWSMGKPSNMLFGLQLAFGRLGSTANALSSEYIYKGISDLNCTGPECIGIVSFVAGTTCFASVFCAWLLACMHRRSEQVTKQNKDIESESVKLTDLKDFKMIYWLIVLIISVYNLAIFSFASLGKMYVMKMFAFEPDQANTAMSLVYIVSAIFAPIFGFLVNKTGRNIIWTIAGIVGSLFAHVLLAVAYLSPYACTALLGMSYSMVASSASPMIALVVPEHQLGTAYGVNQALLNLNLAVMSIVCGLIVDNYGYFELELFLIAWVVMSLVPAIVIWMSNS